MSRDIVASDEFASHATKPGQATFVTALYEGALGRDSSASEATVAVGMPKARKR